MKSLVVRVDEETLAALNRVAAPGRRRSEFVRAAIHHAIRQAEYREMREAYLKQPDSALYADGWCAPEEFPGLPF